ncbi:MAG: two-component system response regulator [Leptolyngbya sp.]|nr:MAG: two-component system response regulator [Leptolyngbya sp.]
MYTVLIIDDDFSIRIATQASIEIVAGWKTLLAASGAEGLTIAQAESPDVILLDVMMPEMDGVTTLRHLRSHPATRSIPVILFTSAIPESDPRVFSELSILGIISKPFDATELVEQMQALLQEKKYSGGQFA